jgi:hypothetical protein
MSVGRARSRVTRGQGVGREVQRAGQRERVGQQLQRMTQVDDVNRLAGIQLALQLFGLQTRGNEIAQNTRRR